MKRAAIIITSTLALLLPIGGCTRWHAYEGPRRPRAEVALLEIFDIDPGAGPLSVDGAAPPRDDVRRIELLPGRHDITWTFVYPNRHRSAQALCFEAAAGRRYRLGQRFFPAPDPGGPIVAAFGTIIDTALLPLAILDVFATDPGEPPPGAYFAWIADVQGGGAAGAVVAGDAPDVPLGHAEITFLPE